jgi:hypothetical protein
MDANQSQVNTVLENSFFKSTLILSFHPYLDLTGGLFSSGLSIIVFTILSHTCACCMPGILYLP